MNAKTRGLRTAAQAVSGLVVGLVVTVWSVDGVPQAVFNYVGSQALLLVGTTGLAAGLIGYLMNRSK